MTRQRIFRFVHVHYAEIALIFILLIGISLRFLGLGWGLPDNYHPDEPTHVGILLRILKTGDFNPHWFKYPSFRIYVSLPIAIIYFLLGVSRGMFRSVQELEAARPFVTGSSLTDIPGLYYALRAWMALFGIAGILFVYTWSKDNYNKRIGVFAALFLSISWLHVLVSHWYRPDTILVLFSGAAVLAAARLLRDGSRRAYLLCGVLAGLAASVKYNAAVIQFVPIILAHILARRRLWDMRLLLVGLSAAGVFIVITPYALLDLPAFLDGFAFEVDHYYVRGHVGADVTGGPIGNFLWYVGRLLYYEGPLLLLALLGCLLVPKFWRGEMIVLSSWPLAVLALNATARVRTVLALVPLLLILYVLAAQSLDTLLRRIQHVKTPHRTLLGGLLVLLVVSVPIYHSIRVTSYFVQPDVRETARDWIREHLPADAKLAIEAYGPIIERPGTRYCHLLIHRSPSWYQAAGVEYVVASHYWGFFETPALYPDQIAAYEALFTWPSAVALQGPKLYLYEPWREIRIHEVPIPQRLDLFMAEPDAPWLTSGFFEPEAHDDLGAVRWTGPEAMITLRLKPSTDYRLRLTAWSWRPDDESPAATRLIIDGTLYGLHEWTEGQETWEVTVRTTESVPTHIVLLTNPWVPDTMLQNGDTRNLGILLHTISVEELGVIPSGS